VGQAITPSLSLEIYLSLPKQSKAKGGSRNFVEGSGVTSCVRPSVTSSSHTIEARGMKIVMNILHIDGSKVTNQIFNILPRSRNI